MNLKQRLDYHYKAFDKSQISPDPLQFLHLYNDEKDIEVMGFIASIFAYGNVNQIINTLNKFVDISDNQPYKFTASFSSHKKDKRIKSLYHRFYSTEDIINLFFALEKIYDEYGLLKNLFLKFYNPDDNNIKNVLSGFSHHFVNEIKKTTHKNELSIGTRFMFPLPELGSACKRNNLFLRWMIRKDELDFGLWKEIPKSKLIIPVDTHIARICKQLKLTTLKNVGWKWRKKLLPTLKNLIRMILLNMISQSVISE